MIEASSVTTAPDSPGPLYAQYKEAQGLRWTSREDDSAQAVMLFGARVESAGLVVTGPSTAVLADNLASPAVIDLAMRLGVTLVESEFAAKASHQVMFRSMHARIAFCSQGA